MKGLTLPVFHKGNLHQSGLYFTTSLVSPIGSIFTLCCFGSKRYFCDLCWEYQNVIVITRNRKYEGEMRHFLRHFTAFVKLAEQHNVTYQLPLCKATNGWNLEKTQGPMARKGSNKKPLRLDVAGGQNGYRMSRDLNLWYHYDIKWIEIKDWLSTARRVSDKGVWVPPKNERKKKCVCHKSWVFRASNTKGKTVEDIISLINVTTVAWHISEDFKRVTKSSRIWKHLVNLFRVGLCGYNRWIFQ